MVILVIAIAVRIAIPVISWLITGDQSVFIEPYTARYVELAEHLLKQGAFTEGSVPEIYRTPGYPVFLIPAVISGKLVPIALILQIMVSIVTLFFFRALARTLVSERPADAATLLLAIDPLWLVFPSLLVPETLFGLCVVFGLLGLVKTIQNDAAYWMILGGAGFAAAAFVYPVAYFLPFQLVLSALFLRIVVRTVDFRRIALISIIAFAPLTFWQARNYIQTGFCGFSTVFAQALYFGHQTEILSKLSDKPSAIEQEALLKKLGQFSRTHESKFDQLRFMRNEGLKAIADHPITAAKIQVKGMFKTLAGQEAHSYIRLFGLLPESDKEKFFYSRGLRSLLISEPGSIPIGALIITLGVTAITLSIYLLALAGLTRNSLDFKYAFILLSVAFYFLVMTGGPFGYSRYRYPIMPIICIFGGVGLDWLLSWKAKKQG
jgi:hypothetical protein